MAEKGKGTKQVIRKLAQDVDTFIDNVISEVERMKLDAERLGQHWQDSQYDNFLSYVNELDSQINKDLIAMDEVSFNIWEIVKVLED